MKKVLCGNEQGYLIQKKELDDKLRAKFSLLKDTIITCIHAGNIAVDVHYVGADKITQLEHGAITFETKGEILRVPRKVFNEIIEKKEHISHISQKHKRDEKYYDDYGGWVIDDKDYFYLLSTNDMFFSYNLVVEVRE